MCMKFVVLVHYNLKQNSTKLRAITIIALLCGKLQGNNLFIARFCSDYRTLWHILPCG